MSKTKNNPTLLMATLYFSSIFHVIGGLMILYSQESAQTYGEIVFGYILNINQEMEYILRILGIYALAFGTILFFSAKNPTRYKPVILSLLIIYIYRVFHSVFTFETIHSLFQVPAYRIYIAIFILSIISILLIIGYLRLPKQTEY